MAIAKNNLVTLEGSNKLIEERIKIWESYENALGNISKLKKLSDKFTDPNTETLESPLTTSGTPPEEIDASIIRINQEVNNIQMAKLNIKSCQDEIKKIKENSNIIVAFAIYVVIAIIVILVVN